MMSRQHRLIQLPLVGTILLCLFVGMYLVVWKRFSKAGHRAPIRKHSVDTKADETLKYWTKDRMRHAKPVDLPNVTALDRGKEHPRGPRV